MSDILNASGEKMASFGDDGKVRNREGNVIGYVTDDNRVHTTDGDKVGYFDFKGYVYKGDRLAGKIRPDGTVYDENDHLAGKVKGDRINSAGAALLLLVI